jgi:hypothetical protein
MHVERLTSKLAGGQWSSSLSSGDEAETTTVTSVAVRVMVKYVRREVRRLTDADREAWLSAVQVLQHVPTSAGQELYGINYYSKDHFTRLHLYYGGARECDHWHGGAGFVTSHVALTLMWEQALQSVNPTVAAPYWDFTLDSTFYGASDWATSFVFSDDWFGEASPANDLHATVSGRFGFVFTLCDASEYSALVNSYGLMRAPWNNDPTPFLTRSGFTYGYANNLKPSGCSEYAAVAKLKSWMALSAQLNFAAHGHIHELVGGSWNHYFEDKTDARGATSPALFTFLHQIETLAKMLWRAGYVTCPDTCHMATPSADCMCVANEAALGNKPAGQVLHEAGVLSVAEFYDSGFHSLTPSDFLDATNAYKPVLEGYTEAESTHVYEKLLDVLVNPGHIGDMYQATSSNDITFWTIHLTLDRLWHFKRLGNMATYNDTWGVIDTCYGNNPQDVQPFKNLFGETGSGAYAATSFSLLRDANAVTLEAPPATKPDTYYTNMDLYGLLHPASRKLQYVYDNFNWPHCEATGFPITTS